MAASKPSQKDEPSEREVTPATLRGESSDTSAVSKQKTTNGDVEMMDEIQGTSTPKSDLNENGKRKKQPRKSNTPFQRIKADTVSFADERLKDNSFHARVRCLHFYPLSGDVSCLIYVQASFWLKNRVSALI